MQPRWRADGAELFYLDQRGRLVAVRVNGGPVFDAGPPSTLFQTKILPQGSQSLWFYAVYAVAGDGQTFFINAAPDDPGPPITVMFNWPAVPR